ncbi:hypothetical protein DRO59_06140 [Candidatus Bathyarchaeota archaeon]|nr:MAG: hypothetical protein DRO59_06140 [Candidatus Bathyarchaeota archaeon]
MKRVVIDIHKMIPVLRLKDLDSVMQMWVDMVKRTFSVEVIETGTLVVCGDRLCIKDDVPLTVKGTNKDIKRFMDALGLNESDIIKEEFDGADD